MYAGEKTLLTARPTRLISFGHYVGAFFFGILGAALLVRLPQWFYPEFPEATALGLSTNTIAAAFLFFVALVFLLVAELKRITTRYIITDNKIVREDGILNKRTQMIPYTHLERIDLRQTFLQRILRIGTVIVDTGDDAIDIDMVPHPKRIQELLSDRLGRRGSAGPAR